MKSNTIRVYDKWLKTATDEQVSFVDSVYELCEKNYESGGDTVVEAYTPDEVIEAFSSLDEVKNLCGLVLEQATNCRYGSDDDPELKRMKRFDDWTPTD